MMTFRKAILAVFFLFSAAANVHAQPADTKPMQSRWSAQVNKNSPLNEYPRPDMVRPGWQNLNGQWDYAITPHDRNSPAWEGKILVPFPVESQLSGVQRRVGKDSILWYRRGFTVNRKLKSEKVILHFGAVDWRAEIFVNGRKVGIHSGGFTSFSFDISAYLNGGSEELQVRVWDPTDAGPQARGKQVTKPGGIYYTPATGIWQTVWLEVVPETYIRSFKVQTDIDRNIVNINPELSGVQNGDKLSVSVMDGSKRLVVQQFDPASPMAIHIPGVKLWSPEQPHLYTFRLGVQRNGKLIDQVEGYFGMRKISIAKDPQGIDRMYLNNKEVFQYGPLDQGYWPDGIYTAPTEEALVSDIKMMKEAGFNMVRKHVKVEPQRWYYHCDKIGLLVWQDMPSGYGEIVPVKDHDYSIEGDWLDRNYKDVERDSTAEAMFREEWQSIIAQLYNFPSICMWVPFNESWGQFKTNEILRWTKELDPTRIVDGPSGWIDRGEGETRDYHLYGDRLKPMPIEQDRALVIGEFGGLGYAVPGHLYSKDAWSYKGFKNEEELYQAYRELLRTVDQLRAAGFAAAVYTQLTDVETEINGLLTYDREKIKIALPKLRKLHQDLIEGRREESRFSHQK